MVGVPPKETECESMTDALTQDEFSKLVEVIYKGPLESPPWKSFAEAIRLRLAANFAVLILRPATQESPQISAVIAGPHSSEATEAYGTRFFELDPFVGLPPSRVVIAAELIGERQWLESTFYREYLEPLDVRHVLGADLRTEEGEECRFRLTRSPTQPPFDTQDKAICQSILPHLVQAVHLRSKLGVLSVERQLLAGTIGRMQVGTVTLDAKGAILSINEEAQAILDANDGIRMARGALQADYPEDNARIQKLISDLLAGRVTAVPSVVDAVSVARPSGRSKLSVLIRAIPSDEWSDGKHQPKVVVYLRDPESKSQGSIDLLRRLFDLTHAEALLAQLLARGLTLDEAAEQCNIRRNTARAHLRSIFSKMGVTRQTELVRLVLNSVVQLG